MIFTRDELDQILIELRQAGYVPHMRRAPIGGKHIKVRKWKRKPLDCYLVLMEDIMDRSRCWEIPLRRQSDDSRTRLPVASWVVELLLPECEETESAED